MTDRILSELIQSFTKGVRRQELSVQLTESTQLELS